MSHTFGVTALCGVLGLALLAGAADAQAPARGAPAPASTGASKDPAAAPAGTYKLDQNHTSVIARIGHANGFSFSTFRFGTAAGTLTWNPAAPEATKLDVTVDTKSISSPVPGFAEELAGERYLNAAKWPQAHFVSTSVRRTGPTKGEFSGQLTLMGVTKPVVFEAELVGAGRGMRGNVIGFTGHTHFKRSDFGFSSGTPMIGDEVELIIDGEFNQQS